MEGEKLKRFIANLVQRFEKEFSWYWGEQNKIKDRESICESIVNYAKETGQLKHIQVTDVLSIIRDTHYE
jgi:hypothetical protein